MVPQPVDAGDMLVAAEPFEVGGAILVAGTAVQFLPLVLMAHLQTQAAQTSELVP